MGIWLYGTKVVNGIWKFQYLTVFVKDVLCDMTARGFIQTLRTSPFEMMQDMPVVIMVSDPENHKELGEATGKECVLPIPLSHYGIAAYTLTLNTFLGHRNHYSLPNVAKIPNNPSKFRRRHPYNRIILRFWNIKATILANSDASILTTASYTTSGISIRSHSMCIRQILKSVILSSLGLSKMKVAVSLP